VGMVGRSIRVFPQSNDKLPNYLNANVRIGELWRASGGKADRLTGPPFSVLKLQANRPSDCRATFQGFDAGG
jgi:hypothetical protein